MSGFSLQIPAELYTDSDQGWSRRQCRLGFR
jgi:hypothetical protein